MCRPLTCLQFGPRLRFKVSPLQVKTEMRQILMQMGFEEMTTNQYKPEHMQAAAA